MKKIRVLVVDDSALMRKIVSDMIDSENNMEVVDTARNGQDLVNKLSAAAPDVITLDVEMPIMDGITALKELKKRNINIPVIMLSSVTIKGTQLTMECLEAGAFDFIPKPSGSISLDINKVKEDLVEKINLACGKASFSEVQQTIRSEHQQIKTERSPMPRKISGERIDAVVIGASTGGPKALYTVITALPKNLGVPVFVVQHMPIGFTKAFADRLNANSDIKVVEAAEGDAIEKDVVYIAPGGTHMEIGLDRKIHLNLEPPIWGVRPAVDKLFLSAVKLYGSRLVSAVLTGMGRDGANGTAEIKNCGGITLSEDRSTCTIYGMPKAAFETGKVDLVLPITDISNQITKIVAGGRR